MKSQFIITLYTHDFNEFCDWSDQYNLEVSIIQNPDIKPHFEVILSGQSRDLFFALQDFYTNPENNL